MGDDNVKTTPKYVRDFSGLYLEDLGDFDRYSVGEFEINQSEQANWHPECFEEEGARKFLEREYKEWYDIPRGIRDAKATDLEKAVAAYLWGSGKTTCGRELNWSLYFKAPFKNEIERLPKFIDVGIPESLEYLGDQRFRLLTDSGEYMLPRGNNDAMLFGVVRIANKNEEVFFRNISVVATLASYSTFHNKERIPELRTLPQAPCQLPLMSEDEAWGFLYRNHLPDYMALIPNYANGVWYDSIALDRRIKEPSDFRLQTALFMSFCGMRYGLTPERGMKTIFECMAKVMCPVGE